jgi:integrating conjugative element protein (TIGR03759 family)
MKNWKVILFTTAMLSPLAKAETEVSQIKNSPTTYSQFQLLEKQAELWDLNTEELQRYQQLMKGPRGLQSPDLDPLSTLGIEAETQAERRRYAEKWVKAEFVRTQKELNFQREIDAAWLRLYPDMLPVHMGDAAQDDGNRLALFVKAKDCLPCDARLSSVLAGKHPVDIYLVDSQGDDELLRQWATEHHISAEKVRARQITLNHDGGRWIRFGNGIMPVLLKQGEAGWHITAF